MLQLVMLLLLLVELIYFVSVQAEFIPKYDLAGQRDVVSSNGFVKLNLRTRSSTESFDLVFSEALNLIEALWNWVEAENEREHGHILPASEETEKEVDKAQPSEVIRIDRENSSSFSAEDDDGARDGPFRVHLIHRRN